MTTITLGDQVAGLTAVVAAQADTIRRLTAAADAAREDLRVAIQRLGEAHLDLAREREPVRDLAARLAAALATIDEQAKALEARDVALRAVSREHTAMAHEITAMRAVLMAGKVGVLVVPRPEGGWRN